MHLRSLPALGPIVTRPRPGLRRRLQCPAVDHHCRGLALATAPLAQQRAHIFHQQLKTTCPQPTLHLLVHDVPGRKIVRKKTPLPAGSRHIPYRVEHRSQIVLSPRTVLRAKQQIRQYECPLLVRHIARITTMIGHPSMLDTLTSPAKNLNKYKVPNRL